MPNKTITGKLTEAKDDECYTDHGLERRHLVSLVALITREPFEITFSPGLGFRVQGWFGV